MSYNTKTTILYKTAVNTACRCVIFDQYYWRSVIINELFYFTAKGNVYNYTECVTRECNPTFICVVNFLYICLTHKHGKQTRPVNH